MQAKRILLVEDDQHLNLMLQEFLTDEGYACIAANSADEAVPVLKSQPFDLVLSDIDMPGSMNGVDLAVEARAAFPDVPIVLMSGKDWGEQIRVKASVSAFLAKPFNLGTLRNVIEAAIQIFPRVTSIPAIVDAR